MTQTEKLHFIKLDPLLTRNVDCEHRRAFSSYLVSEGSARVRECRAARPRKPLSVLLVPSVTRVVIFRLSRNLLDRLRKKRSDCSQTTKPEAHNKKPKGYKLFHQVDR